MTCMHLPVGCLVRLVLDPFHPDVACAVRQTIFYVAYAFRHPPSVIIM
jgi:hypothetical protein